MKDEQIRDLLEKAKQSLLASEKLLENGFSDFSVSRSYYTMFYIVEAILLSKDLSFSKHSGVISAFGKNFIKSGIIDKKFHQYILEAFELRNEGDYGSSNSIGKDVAIEMISHSKEFLEMAENFLI